jgi:hypothetical protein
MSPAPWWAALFADAEAGEDGVEDCFDAGLAGDAGEGLVGGAEVFGDEFGELGGGFEVVCGFG